MYRLIQKMSISYREIFEITFIHLVFYSRNKKGWLFLASEAPSAPDERDDVTEKTEVIYGSENVVNRGIQGIPLAKETIDLCGEEAGPSTIVANEPILKKYIEASKRGVRIRQITEITKNNILDCKKLMDCMKLRHLDGLYGYFVVVDGKMFNSHAYGQEAKSFPHMVTSTVKVFVQQQQFFFETLWNKGIPAEERIREIEEGIEPERTEVWRDPNEISMKAIEILTHAKIGYDHCIDWKGPSIIVNNESIKKAYLQLIRSGAHIRLLTDITQDNVSYCKQLSSLLLKVRHLDQIKGNFGIVDRKYYGGTAYTRESAPPEHYLFSNVREFVEQQQSFFEMLWERAVPAEQRIKEIEEGRTPEKLVIIQDTQKSISRAFDIMNKTRKELLVIFATPRTFTLALRAGAADIYRKMSENGINIQVLVPRGGAKIEENNEQIAKLREEISPSINLRLSEVDLNTRITIMISDRKEFMSWELRDDSLDDPYLAGGIATYSNIEALASSYAIIFDNLWKITEFAENLRIANIKLESNEKAMKEFINIAAHALRTPIQPILGLSEMLADASSNDPQQQRKLFEIIIRNARKLENLAEDILDVTRIESGRLKLAMEKVDLHELVESVVHEFQRFLPADGKVTLNYQKLIDDRDDDHHGIPHLEILGDPQRIVQVLSNLLGNALKFTKEGTINVRVGRKDSPSSSEAIVSISDSGQGIDPEAMCKLFEKFMSKSEKGTGLGLFISKSIVEAHGGKTWGENNKDGKGATFTFTLPLVT
jgi:two-component system sensor histidine kinase VicK